MGHVTLTTPPDRFFGIHWLGLAMFNLPTKFEVSFYTGDEDMKNEAKCRRWGGLEILRGQSGSWDMAPFSTTHTSSY